MKQERGARVVFGRQPLDSGAAALYLRFMTRVFDMDDRARLPWRFFGALCSVPPRR